MAEQRCKNNKILIICIRTDISAIFAYPEKKMFTDHFHISLKNANMIFLSTHLLTFFVFLHVRYYNYCFETKCRAIYQQIDG